MSRRKDRESDPTIPKRKKKKKKKKQRKPSTGRRDEQEKVHRPSDGGSTERDPALTQGKRPEMAVTSGSDPH